MYANILCRSLKCRSLKQFNSNIQELDNLIKENQNKAKEFNIGSIKVVLEMTEDTTKYEVSRA